MKRWRSIVKVLPLVLCLTLGVSGCANRQPETARYAPEEDRRLVVYTSHKEEVYWPIVREFEDRTGIWVEVVAGGTNELLARRFNGMVGALKRNQEQLVENQRELNQAQIRMLQAQLNPHFLCNTLDTMKWIGKIHQVPQVALMAANLGDILRFCISREEFVPISREVEILRRYMEIQSIRLSGRCSLTVELPEEMEGLLVPRMILQPIVENALLHGLPGVENGVVQVKVWKEGERMKITVTDYTILNYLTRHRIHRAMKLLRDCRMKVYEVAEQVGYRDITYFSATFKKVAGVSPSEYQDTCR